MKIFKYMKIYILLVTFILFINLLQIPVYSKDLNEKKILVIVSSENYIQLTDGNKLISWQNSMLSSISDVFIKNKENIHIDFQYLDCKHNSKEFLDEVYNLFKIKYANIKYDAIITIDDLNNVAFNFMMDYGENLFPNTPVVFSGISKFDSSLQKQHPQFTGIAKNTDIKSTLDAALKLHPQTKQIFVITDKDTYGIANRKIIEDLIPHYKNKVKFLFSEENNIYKLKTQIDNLPKDTIIYFSPGIKDNNNDNSISYKGASDILFKDAKVPIYSREGLKSNKYIVGGMVTYADTYGTEVGNLTLKVLNGKKPSDIDITRDNAHKYEFNYPQLKKFNIDTNSLPKNSVILNAPIKNNYLYKNIIIKISIMIIIFIIIMETFVIIISIYRRKLAEKSLSDNENLLRTFINSTPDIIYLKDFRNNFLEINDAALKILSINRKNCKNINSHKSNNLSDYTRNLLKKFNINDKRAWDTENIYRYEEIIPDTVNRANKIYDTLRVPLFDEDGNPKFMMLIGRDITEHKQNEKNEKLIKELKYYDELRSNFFSNISHELKTPLNLIFSALQFIELKNNKDKNTALEKYTGIMKQNCYRLLRIIDNLIDISKIDSGNFFTHFENKDIVYIVESIVMSVVDYVESKGIDIVFDTDVEEKIMAFDLDAMERIILNLLSNAIKFTPSGGNIEVNLHDRGESIVISIKDTGIGIPKDKQCSIFKKFIQVDKSLSRNREGSGIGLSLVSELVLLHRGTIEVESAPNKGSEFKITLPVGVLPEKENVKKHNELDKDYNIQRIKIEFSDIYDY